MNSGSRNLADQGYWNEGYKAIAFAAAPEKDEVRRFIARFFKKETERSTVFEIGCFPGRYLAVFGDLGFSLNGIDLTPRVDDLKQWLMSERFSVGNFYRANFLTFQSQEQYDVVASFGFIEHFTDWDEQIIRHVQLVKDHGFIIITTPNFKGTIQNFLHRYFDRENYNRHFIPSMDPGLWVRILESRGFEIVFSGYFGKFDFWTDYKRGSILGKMKRACTYALGRALWVLLVPFPGGSREYSPYCGVVARRK